MSSGLVTIGRRVYAVGLYWENSPGGRISQIAKEAARQPGQHADFFAVRPGNKAGRVAQFGLGQAAAGHRAGLPALAACMANQQPGSWAGAFRLREGTTILVVRDDLVVPDGDQFYIDETEARDRLVQEMSFGGLQRVYAPEAWGVPGADTLPITLLLNDRVDVKLQPVALPRNTILFSVAAAAILCAILGIGWFINAENARQEAERQAQLNALMKAKEEAGKKLPVQQKVVEYPAPERKWEKKPQALAVIESCRAALTQVPIAVVGWQISSVKCDGVNLKVNWNHVAGYSMLPEGATINDSGTTASLSVNLPNLTPRGAEDLWAVDAVTQRILAQNWGAQLTRASAEPLPPAPPGFIGSWEPPPPPWVKRSFTLTTPVLPWNLPVYFNDLPGVVINTVSSGALGTAWTVEGVIYENRQ